MLRLLARLGAGADIVSHGEMKRALAAGLTLPILFFPVSERLMQIFWRLLLPISARSMPNPEEAEVERILALAADALTREAGAVSCRLALDQP